MNFPVGKCHEIGLLFGLAIKVSSPQCQRCTHVDNGCEDITFLQLEILRNMSGISARPEESPMGVNYLLWR